MRRRDFIAAFGALAVPFKGQSDESHFLTNLLDYIGPPSAFPDDGNYSKFEKTYHESGLDPNAKFPRGGAMHTLLSVAYAAQTAYGHHGGTYTYWQPERGKIIAFLLANGADINSELVSSSHRQESKAKGKGYVVETILDRIAVQVDDIGLIKIAFWQGGRSIDPDRLLRVVRSKRAEAIAAYEEDKKSSIHYGGSNLLPVHIRSYNQIIHFLMENKAKLLKEPAKYPSPPDLNAPRPLSEFTLK